MKVVEATAVRKEFASLVAVRDVDLTIEEGQVLGLIGPNGAGKTTLLKMLATLLRPTSGTIRVLGKDTRADYESVRRNLGFMPDFFNLYDGLTLDECVRFFGRCYGVLEEQLEARVRGALDFVGLLEKQFEPIQHLSRGMTQRLGVANLLVHDPPLIILDEPASGLDPVARIRLRRVLLRLANEGKTVVVSSHILSELEELCTHVCAMHRGRIITHGTIGEIRREFAASVVTVSLAGSSGHSPEEGALSTAASIAEKAPGVLDVSIQRERLRIHIEGGASAHAQLNAQLVNQGVRVAALHAESGGLEALFSRFADAEEESLESRLDEHAEGES